MKMNVFEKLMKDYWIDRPEGIWTFLGDPKEADAIPNEHKDQIHFLSKEGDEIIGKLINNSRMLFDWWKDVEGVKVPFNREYFKNFEEFSISVDAKSLKKWLFERGFPFSKYVFLFGDNSAMLTWKMVIKYCESIFHAHDLIIIDSSLEWALFYIHNDSIYFGKDVIFDRDKHGEKVYKINQIIKDAREKSRTEN